MTSKGKQVMNEIDDGRPRVSAEANPAADSLQVRDILLCKEDLEACRRELAATQARLEQSEERAARLSRVQSERDKLALALASYLSKPPVVQHPVKIGGWRGWLIERLQGSAGQIAIAEVDPRIERLESSPLFDAAWYLRTYPDVAMAGERPALHYLYHGANEGRSPSPAFDSAFYLARYKDVRDSGINPLIHFELIGQNEGRLPAHPQADPVGSAGQL